MDARTERLMSQWEKRSPAARAEAVEEVMLLPPDDQRRVLIALATRASGNLRALKVARGEVKGQPRKRRGDIR
jgi:hypothetical protein